jgi:hypothetical protein
MKTITITISLLLLASVALASRPVHVNITGCVQHGVLISEQTDFGNHVSTWAYRIRVTDRKGDAVDLSPYEEKRISVTGNLLPGDRFILNPGPIRVLGNCGMAQQNQTRNLKNRR